MFCNSVSCKTTLVVLLLLLLNSSSVEGTMKEISAHDIMRNISEGKAVNYDGYIIKGDLTADNLSQTYVFSWDDILRNDTGRLKELLVKTYGFKWVENASINKTDNNNINISAKGKSILLTLNEEQKNVDVIIDRSTKFTKRLIAKMEINMSKIYIVYIYPKIDIYLPRVVNSEINIKNCTIDGIVDLNNVIFQKPITFSNTSFNKPIIFNDTIFNKSIDFSNAQFHEGASFLNAYFNGEANFENAKLNGTSIFQIAKFRKKACFNRAQFNGPANFQRTEFDGTTNYDGCYFDNAQFNGGADFSDAKFLKFASFRRSIFKDKILFIRTVFKDVVNTIESKFEGDADFSEAIFDKTPNSGGDSFQRTEFAKHAYFKKTQFKKSVQFEDATFSDDVFFNSAIFSGYEVSFNRSNFKGKAFFENTSFSVITKVYFNRLSYTPGKLYIRWNSIKVALCRDITVILSLNKNFVELGYIDDSDYTYYVYRQLHREDELSCSDWKAPIIKVIDYLLDKSYKYGIDPINPSIISLIIVFIFAVFWLHIGRSYVFIWDEVPGNDEDLLNEILVDKYEIDWVKNAKIEKVDDNRTIRLFTNGKSISLKLNYKKTEVVFETDNHKIIKFIAKMENEKLNIYEAFCYEYSLLFNLTFSFKVFLAGTKFFIDTPELPKRFKKSTFARSIYYSERILGALLFGLIFFAVSRSFIRN